MTGLNRCVMFFKLVVYFVFFACLFYPNTVVTFLSITPFFCHFDRRQKTFLGVTQADALTDGEFLRDENTEVKEDHGLSSDGNDYDDG